MHGLNHVTRLRKFKRGISPPLATFHRNDADMAGILIIAHAPFATALRDCISHIYGGLPARIGVIDVTPDNDPAKLLETAETELERLLEENGALVLTDLY